MAGTVGRPRKNSTRRRGSTAREEILDAASELFTRQGFATTSTHQIAEAVGIRQASLYYHFPSKTEIFLTLLQSTVEPALTLAERLAESDVPAELRLWALVAAKANALLASRWNVGRLYQLPIANSPEFTEYHTARQELEKIFRQLAEEIVGVDDPRLDMPFYLSLAVVEMRSNDGSVNPDAVGTLHPTAIMVADATLDVLHAPLPEDRVQRTLALLA
ncbi:TetR/AcrR family transcriptional regulator [Corynebacterium uterequi]|uniref:Transcriptional regulator, TetR family n=1 Tax=Corynebacterium uterequi TaxID=1072256 RepID=A0A0G3HFI8_9CORY|nr:TetR/AcrR family transcriptional regulator [Corynebacterium uterequi]AKK10688.1 transcriptional regulator, TetR family [Corynebacterium uterequi]